MERDEQITVYLSWALILGVLIISYFIIKDFLIAIISAFILAYLLKPVHDRLEKKVGKIPAALISVLSVLIIILSIIGFIIGSLISEISTLLSGNFIQLFFDKLQDLPFEAVLINNLSEIIKEAGKFALNLVTSSAINLPGKVLAIFVTFFTAYYILIDWETLKNKSLNLLPFQNRQQILTQIQQVIDDIITGTFLIALIETVVAIIGFSILGIKFAVLLGFIIGLFAFIPALGPLLIWVPLAIITFTRGQIGTTIGIIILGLILSAYIDSILRIKLVGKKSKIHPVIVLIGLFGGISLFGAIGLILGPLILSISVTIIENIPKLKLKK